MIAATRLAASAAACALVLAAQCVHAVPTTFSGLLDFQANESIWGPGSSAAAFGAAGSTGSNATVSLSYSTGASTGTVSARFAGNLNALYDDVIPLSSAGSTPLGLSFAGSSGNLTTALGAHLNVSAHVLNIPITIFNADYSLDINRNFTPSFASPVVTGSDSQTVARAAFGPNIVVATVQAGLDGNIRETARLNTTGVLGHLRATHRASGTLRDVAFDLDVNGGESLAVDLGLAGFWDLQFTDLRLENFFNASFLMDLQPFVEYFVGFNCGDPGSNDDNLFGCVEDGRAAFNLASVNLLSSSFALDFGVRTLPAFELFVDALSEVAEPSVLALLAAALAGLVFSRRRRAAA